MFHEAKEMLEQKIGEPLSTEEVLYLTGLFEPEEEHPETMRDFLVAFRRGYEVGFNEARALWDTE